MTRGLRLEISFRGRSWPAFQACGVAGAVLAWTLALVLAVHAGLSVWLMGGLAAMSVATFLGLAMATKIVIGRENLVYYHHEIAVMVADGLLLRVWHKPVLPYLDLVILGIGTFLIFGRLGCLMAGCCHGRPCRWGVRYGERHVAAGFTPYYAGVRLFPVQALESGAVLLIVLAGTYLVWHRAPAGTALGCYAIAYNAVRYGLEFLRGDPQRPYLAGVSQAQWIALALSLALSLGELFGWLPMHAWHLAVTSALLAATAATAYLWRRALLGPRHVQEIAEAVARLDRPPMRRPGTAPAAVEVSQTSLGLCISGVRLRQASGPVDYYAISSRAGLSQKDARKLAALIARLRHAGGAGQLAEGHGGVYHIIIHSAGL